MIKKDQIDEVIEELRNAMIEDMEADMREDEAKLLKIKAHKRLLLAKEAIRNLK